MSLKSKFSVVREHLVYYRMHDKNESLLNRDRHIKELKIWFNENKKGELSKIDGFDNFKHKILELEITKSFLEKNINKHLKVLSFILHPLKRLSF